MNEQLKKFISKYIWTVIILFCLRCWISWNSLVNNFSCYDIFGYAGEAIGIATFFIALYERILWRYDWFNDTPVLSKKYSGVFISSYDGIEREASIKIKQTLLTINIIFITGESKSKSISASIDNIFGENILTYCYINTPDAGVRGRSQMHMGTAIISVDNTQELKGQYFTDRKTTGDIKFKVDNSV